MIEQRGRFIISRTFIPDSSRVITTARNQQIIRQTDSRGTHQEIKYSTNAESTYIRGYQQNDYRYHITSVVNKSEPLQGIKSMSLIFDLLQEELRDAEIGQITTNCLLPLSPVLVKRYGFQVFEKKLSYEELLKRRKGWRRHIPWQTYPLYKDL